MAGRRYRLVATCAAFAAALLACGRSGPATTDDSSGSTTTTADPSGSATTTAVAQERTACDGPRITVRSLGPGMAFGVNDAGQVAGERFTRALDGPATLWNPDGSVVDIGALAAEGSGTAFDVNDLGAAAGVGGCAFSWTASGGIVSLGAPGGDYSRARAINNLGQVVGDVEGYGPDLATLWEPDGSSISLGTLGGPSSGANDINDAGQVVGWSHVPNDGGGRAFLWTKDAGMQELGTFGGRWTEATGINELGHVTGFSYTAAGRAHAFLWKPGTGMVDLDPLGLETYAEAINDRDEVVGYHYPQGSAQAFFWSPRTGIVELGTLGGWFSRAWDINESGVIVGDSNDGITPELAAVWTLGCVAPDGEPTDDAYDFLGFLRPIQNDGSGVFKAGRTIRVKFRLASASGAPVTGATATLRVFDVGGVTVREVAVVARAPSVGTGFEYDAAADAYAFRLDSGALGPGAYVLRVELDDGTAHEVRITLR